MIMSTRQYPLQLRTPDIPVRQNEFVNFFLGNFRHGLVLTEGHGAAAPHAHFPSRRAGRGDVPREPELLVFHVDDERVVIAIEKIHAGGKLDQRPRARATGGVQEWSRLCHACD